MTNDRGLASERELLRLFASPLKHMFLARSGAAMVLTRENCAETRC